MISSTQKNEVKILTEDETSVIKVLAYFKIFKYPLSAKDVWVFNTIEGNLANTQKTLEQLFSKKLIYKANSYFSIEDDEKLSERRIAGNALAKKMLPRGIERGKFIHSFPFVRAVFISGTLSKNYMDEESDIDFFVVTKSKRMWIARTFLILFKKTFLLNSSKYFCLNYFIDNQDFNIKEQNQFTATELATLIPVTNNDILKKLNESNKWLFDFYPNQKENITAKKAEDVKDGYLKKAFELLFDNKLGDWLNNYLMNLTKNFWNKKFKNLAKKDFDIGLKSTENVSKHHPKNYQDKVKIALAKNLREFETANNVKLWV